MKIEAAINQKKFKNAWHKATVNLIYTHNWIENNIKSLLKPYGITTQQYNVLRILRGQFPEPITTSVIRNRMLDKMSDASRIVDRLCKKGFSVRNICPSDKRLVDVLITAEGLKVLDAIDFHDDKLDLTRENLTEEEAILFSDLLDKMRGS